MVGVVIPHGIESLDSLDATCKCDMRGIGDVVRVHREGLPSHEPERDGVQLGLGLGSARGGHGSRLGLRMLNGPS